MNIIDGREELLGEIEQAPDELKRFIALEFESLLGNNLFEYAVQNKTNGDSRREDILFKRIETIANEYRC